MRIKPLTLSVLAFGLLAATAPAPAPAQISLSIGAEPACPYGYYDYAPYNCSPYGYYGPEWFNGGLFLGAGPWFHGRHGFYGHVDNRYDPHNGYRGPLPDRNERAFNHFHPNEARDGQGHIGNAVHESGGEHGAGFAGGGHPGGGFHGGGGRR